MPWLRGGTVAVTNGSTTVIGTNADFAANSRIGDAFIGPDGINYEIGNVASATVISIIPAYKGPTASGVAYAIMPVQGYPKALADAFNNINLQWGVKLAALGTTGNYEILPVAKGGTGGTDQATARSGLGLGSVAVESVVPINKGGTGRNDGRAKLSELGVTAAPALYNVQGMYMGWNTLGTGEGNFIVNMGGGTGGFSWRTVNANNTVGGPSMTLSYDGLLAVPGYIQPRGISGKQGINSAAFTQPYNFNWTGNFEAWVGTTFIGNVAFNTSDYRIKKNIKTVTDVSFLDRIEAYRIVTYRHKNFAVWSDDGRTRQGLIAHEAQEVNPLAVIGEKDEMNADDTPRVQSLDVMTLVTDLMGAIKELRAEINDLKAAAMPAPDAAPTNI